MFLSWLCSIFFFFFNDTATTEIYTLSLHDALPIASSRSRSSPPPWSHWSKCCSGSGERPARLDSGGSYEVGCESDVLTRRALGRATCFAATKVAICRTVRKSSISSSSNATWMEKCSSSEASSLTNMRESTMPSANKSTSAAGTSICRRSANSCAMRVSRSRGSRIRQLPVLGGEEVVQQTVVGPAVDPMTASLASDVLEAEALQATTGGDVDLDGPGPDGFEPQLRETEGQQLGRRPWPIAAVPLFPEHGPHRTGRLEAAIHVRQTHDADRQVAVMGREYAEHVQVALCHHLQRNRGRTVDAVAEIQPLAILLLAQPVGRELGQLAAIQRQELHSCTDFPSRPSAASVRLPPTHSPGRHAVCQSCYSGG